MDDNIAPIPEFHDPIVPSNSRKRKRGEATLETPFPPRKRRRLEGRWVPTTPLESVTRKRKREDDQQKDSNKRQFTLQECVRAAFDLSINYVKETYDEFVLYLRRLHEALQRIYQDTAELTRYVYRRHLARVCQPVIRGLDTFFLCLILCFLYSVYYSLVFMFWLLQVMMILALSFFMTRFIMLMENQN
ncbi:unnamed protein product [Rhizopus stolonifer]